MGNNNVTIDPRYMIYNKDDVQRILGTVDGKVFTVTEFTAENIKNNAESLPRQSLIDFRTRYGVSKSLVLVPVESYGGYIAATVTSAGSTFSMYYVYDGKLWTLTGDSSDEWTVTAKEFADAADLEAYETTEALNEKLADYVKSEDLQVASEENVRNIVKNWIPDTEPEPEEEEAGE